MEEIPYDRETLINVIIYHWRADFSSCGCGWSELGKSYAGHIADVYEMSIKAKGE